MSVENDKRAKAIAEEAAEGDMEVYWTVYNSNSPDLEFFEEVKEQFRGYIFAAVYAFYERNVQNIYKELGIPDYYKEKPTVYNAFEKCNLPLSTYQCLFDIIEMYGLLRNNLSHGRLKNEEHWKKINQYVSSNKSLVMQDDVVVICDNEFLLSSLDTVYRFFEEAFKNNPLFETRYVGVTNPSAST